MAKFGIPSIGQFRGQKLDFLGYSYYHKGPVVLNPKCGGWASTRPPMYVNFRNPHSNKYPLCYLRSNVKVITSEHTKYSVVIPSPVSKPIITEDYIITTSNCRTVVGRTHSREEVAKMIKYYNSINNVFDIFKRVGTATRTSEVEFAEFKGSRVPNKKRRSDFGKTHKMHASNHRVIGKQ